MTDSPTTTGISRRTFIRALGAAGLGFALWGRLPSGELTAIAAIPGGDLDVLVLPKFVTPLTVPPPMPPVAGSSNAYDIEVVQFQQQILPTPHPKTTVWSYAATGDETTRNYPAYTIEARTGEPVTVTWRNHLVDDAGRFLPHLLPVDPTLHWANPPGGEMHRDMRPTFDDGTPGAYTGPVPIVTHVHGMERAYEWADGYPEAWYLPAADDIPDGYATVGTFYDYYEGEADAPGWGSGTATFVYPNSQRASTAWYHDHTLGMTRLNVYAGPAGFYLVRDGVLPTDRRGGGPAVLPEDDYEIPLAIQDRSFNADGSLFYPDTRAFFDGYTGPFIPDSEIAPIWNPEFFGNTIVVNGATWPYLEVEPRRYRFRILNGCQSRFLILELDKRVPLALIGNEGGFLRATATVTQLLLGPAERADVIIDFSSVKGSVRMLNTGPDSPFGGLPVPGNLRADPKTTGQVMEFRVTRPLATRDTSTPPGRLVMPDLPPLPEPDPIRKVALLEKMDMASGAVVEALLGDDTFAASGSDDPHDWAKMWADEITENPEPDAVEEWEIWNFTMDAHPIHLHEVFFEVVNRQAFDPATRTPVGAVALPGPQEDGRKDTVIAYPGQVTRIRMQFGPGGLFVWHCHIVEHEDNEMMRPYHVGDIPEAMKALLHRDHGRM